jgi:hypothetical protein
MEFGSDCCCANLIYTWAKKPFYEPPTDGLNDKLAIFWSGLLPLKVRLHNVFFIVASNDSLEEQIMRRDVCSRLEETVKGLWPHATVEAIGSTCTNLCCPNKVWFCRIAFPLLLIHQ